MAGYLKFNFDCRNDERIAIPADNGIVTKKILKNIYRFVKSRKFIGANVSFN